MAKRKTVRDTSRAVVTAEQIGGAILVIRGQKVLLDEQLAVFYGVEVKRLVEAVKRNIGRFPGDFMFQLDPDEWAALRSQFATLNKAKNLRSRFVTSNEAKILRSQNATSSSGHGGRRYPPYAFTEQGVAMLSSVLRSPRAIEVNIEIMRAFVRLRQLLSLHKDLAERLTKLERQMLDRDADVDQQFRHVFSLLEQLFAPPARKRQAIGFHVGE
ncbi:MAG: ORF6N domain-containing protein [Pirellulales bacterium]